MDIISCLYHTLLSFTGCNKLLDAGSPGNPLSDEKNFTSDSLSRLVVAGIYCSMMREQKSIFIGVEKGSDWQGADKLYPVPAIELNRNRFLTKNCRVHHKLS